VKKKRKAELAPISQQDLVHHCAKILKARVAAGYYRDQPELEADVLAYDPAVTLIEISADRRNTAETRAACAARLMPYWHKDQSLLIKEMGSNVGDTNIVIQVASWASAKPLPIPALPASDNGKVIFED
jgi:hypothetical protein